MREKRTPYQIMQDWEPIPGVISGGYKLLRSEYRVDPDPERWLRNIEYLLEAPDLAGYDYGAAGDLYANGDVLDEDLDLFAYVLRRYIHLRG